MIGSGRIDVNGRALVLFPGALGDFVCFYPALEVLASRSAHTRLLVRGGVGELLPERRLRAGSLEVPAIARLFVAGAGGEREVRDFLAGFDSIHSWSGAGEPVFADNLRAAAAAEWRLFPFQPVAGGAVVRRSEYYLSCVGAGPERLALARMPLRRRAVDWSTGLWRRLGLGGRAVLAVAPGSGAARKNWPLHRFMTVCRWWNRVTGGVSLVLLGPVEQETLPRRGLSPADAVVLEGLSLSRLAAVLARCDAYVGNDSGPTHLAAALGVPTVAVFRVTDAREWRPWGPGVTVVEPEAPADRAAEYAGDVSADRVIAGLAAVAPRSP